jgi:hypothetical protein
MDGTLTEWLPLVERFGVPIAMLIGFLWLILTGKLVAGYHYQTECERNSRCQQKLLEVLELAAQQAKTAMEAIASRRR